MKKIALLFLTRKELNHPRVWQQMLEETPGLFDIYIHSKEPMDDPYFKHYRIPEIVPTTHLVHNKAWQALIREAIKDTQHEKFIYLSESCMPLYPLKDIYHYLINDSNSYIRYSRPWWPQDSPREVGEIPAENRWGNSEWIILNRKHASLIAEDQKWIELVAQHSDDHESYPSSFLSLQGCLDEVIYRQTTYASFKIGRPPYPYHFRAYTPFDEACLNNAKRGGCLFARKFTPEFPPEILLSLTNERLMPSLIDTLPDFRKISPQLEQKIARLQSQEEMSLANSCVLLPLILQEGLFEIGYEIGVGLGLHIDRLVEATSLRQVYGVDEYNRKTYKGIVFDPEEEETLYQYAQNYMNKLNIEAELIRKSSLEVAQTVQDSTVDLIFFNAEQMNNSLEENLSVWFPKLKKGGIMAGYQVTASYPNLDAVIFQFFSNKKMTVHQDVLEPKFWWVQF